MNHDDESLMRQVLQNEALRYQPSAWAGNAAAVRDRSARRRRRVRGTGAVALAVLAMGGAAVGATLVGTPGSPQTREQVAAAATSSASSAPAHPQATSPTSDGTSSPTVRIAPAGQDVAFGHQIWMRLTDSQACVGLGPFAIQAYACSSVVNGNQSQGTVNLRENTDASGTLYTPLYIGPGDASRVTIEIDATTYRATVVKLGGRPGYATGYLWLPGRSQTAGALNAKITVYDAQGNVLATAAPSGS